MAATEASYTRTVGPDGVTFKVVPASSPDARFSISRLLLAAVPAYIAAAMIGGLFGSVVLGVLSVFGEGALMVISGIVSLGMAAVFFYAWYLCYRWLTRWILRKQGESRHAYEVELLVNGSGITVLGTKQFLRHEDIHRMVIKNAFDDTLEIPLSGYVAVGSPMVVGTAAAANAVTNSVAMLANHKRRIAAKISYFITAEAGGVSHKIAGGLSEVCAHGVMTDIGRALRNEIG